MFEEHRKIKSLELKNGYILNIGQNGTNGFYTCDIEKNGEFISCAGRPTMGDIWKYVYEEGHQPKEGIIG